MSSGQKATFSTHDAWPLSVPARLACCLQRRASDKTDMTECVTCPTAESRARGKTTAEMGKAKQQGKLADSKPAALPVPSPRGARAPVPGAGHTHSLEQRELREAIFNRIENKAGLTTKGIFSST